MPVYNLPVVKASFLRFYAFQSRAEQDRFAVYHRLRQRSMMIKKNSHFRNRQSTLHLSKAPNGQLDASNQFLSHFIPDAFVVFPSEWRQIKTFVYVLSEHEQAGKKRNDLIDSGIVIKESSNSDGERKLVI